MRDGWIRCVVIAGSFCQLIGHIARYRSPWGTRREILSDQSPHIGERCQGHDAGDCEGLRQSARPIGTFTYRHVLHRPLAASIQDLVQSAHCGRSALTACELCRRSVRACRYLPIAQAQQFVLRVMSPLRKIAFHSLQAEEI